MIRKKAVTGARDWTDRSAVEAVLDGWKRECDAAGDQLVVVVGDCKTGVDAMTLAWCRMRGVKCSVFSADWAKYGPAAGPIRNGDLAREQPDECAAFPLRGPGTWNCVRQMKQCGVPVQIVKQSEGTRQ